MEYSRLRYLRERREAEGFINAPQRRRTADGQVTATTGNPPRRENPNSGSQPISPRRCPTFEEVTAPKHLLETFRILRGCGGQAAGIDGRTYDDFSTTEIGRILKTASQAIRRQGYRP